MSRLEHAVRVCEIAGIVFSIGLGVYGINQGLQSAEREERNARLALEATEREKENLRIASENMDLEKENLRIAAENVHLERENLRIASETAEREKQSWLLSIRPNVALQKGLSSGVLSIKNSGLGPATIYELHLMGPNSSIVLASGSDYRGDTSTQRKIEKFIRENWPRPISSISIDFAAPLLVLPAGEQINFVSIKPSSTVDQVVDFMESINTLICFTDIVGSRLPGSFNGNPASTNEKTCSSYQR